MSIQWAIGVDLGGSKIRAALVNSKGELMGRMEVFTDTSRPEDPVLQIISLIRELRHKTSISINQIVGIGIGVPGLVKQGGVVWAPNLPGWDSFPLKDKVQEAFPIPVVIDSDRNTAILGEQWLGAAQGVKNAVFLIIGTGIGAGILINGQLYRGHSEAAGVVGWLVVDKEQTEKYRETGCLETRAAGPAIVQKAVNRIKQGAETDIMDLVKGDLKDVTAEIVTQAAQQGDAEARAIMQEVGKDIGIGIANIIDILNPELVILGGGVGKAWPLLKESILEALEIWAQPLAAQSVRVVPSELGEDVGLFGAAWLALQKERVFSQR